MDTSETYIKMCEKAEEIQKLWQPSDWDYIYCRQEEENVVLSGYCTDGGYYGHQTPSIIVRDFYTDSCDALTHGNFKAYHIWLPRQDQLQEILKARYLTPLVGALYKWLKDNDYDQYYFDNVTSNPYFSMEQIWLAFVMSERYHKIWQNGEWKGET